jgi:predicted permease
MSGSVVTTLATVVAGIIQIFFIALLGYVVMKRKLITEQTVHELARLTIDFVIPCFLFVGIYQGFSVQRLLVGYPMCLFAPFSIFLGGLLGLVGSQLFSIARTRRRSIVAMSSFCNSGYLLIPIAIALFHGEEQSVAILYIGLYILFFSPLLWTYGVWLLRDKESERSSGFAAWITPPAIGVVCGVIAALPGPKSVLIHVDFFIKALKMIGDATVPLAMIILGAILATIRVETSLDWRGVGVITATKLLLLPLITLGLVRLFGFPYLLGIVMLIEAAAPPATNLVIIARRYGSDDQFVSSTTFITYLFCILTLPLFVGFYKIFFAGSLTP